MGWSDVRHHYEDYCPEDCAPSWRTLSDSKHTARTPKGCEACGGAIMPGQRYRKIVALEDGDFRIHCYHENPAECAASALAREEQERRDMEAMHEELGHYWTVQAEVMERSDALDADLWSRIAEHFVYGAEP